MKFDIEEARRMTRIAVGYSVVPIIKMLLATIEEVERLRDVVESSGRNHMEDFARLQASRSRVANKDTEIARLKADRPCEVKGAGVCMALGMKRKDYKSACDEVERLCSVIRTLREQAAGFAKIEAERDRLRDKRRFDAACAAMTGLLADSKVVDDSEGFATRAIGVADALLAAMEGK